MNWKSDSKGNHFNDSKKPGLSSTEHSSSDNGTQVSSIQPLTHKVPRNERSENMTKQFGVTGSPVDKENPYGDTLHKLETINTFHDFRTDARTRLDSEHVVAKLIGDIPIIVGYSENSRLHSTDLVMPNNGKDVDVWEIGSSRYLEPYLQKVATDAKMNGLINDNKIRTLINNSTIYYYEQYKPLMIKIKDYTYMIAPADGNPEFESFVKNTMGNLVKEHDYNLEHGIYPTKE